MLRLSKILLVPLALCFLGGTWIASPGKGSHASGALTFAEVQQKNYASTASATSHNLVFDSAPTQNNLIVIGVASDATVSTPSGYTLAQSSVSSCGLYIFYKVAGASESATVALAPAVSDSLAAIGLEYRGTATASPFDVSASSNSGSTTTSIPTGTTATTAQANELCVAMVAYQIFGAEAVSGWSNSFVQEGTLDTTGSSTNMRTALSTLKVTSTGTQTTTATTSSTLTPTPSAAIATFKITNP